jgi:hypothetical protein
MCTPDGCPGHPDGCGIHYCDGPMVAYSPDTDPFSDPPNAPPDPPRPDDDPDDDEAKRRKARKRCRVKGGGKPDTSRNRPIGQG